jgi:hypothetical protein
MYTVLVRVLYMHIGHSVFVSPCVCVIERDILSVRISENALGIESVHVNAKQPESRNGVEQEDWRGWSRHAWPGFQPRQTLSDIKRITSCLCLAEHFCNPVNV